jgi:hypothetical protein
MSHLEIRDRLRSNIPPLGAERLAIRESTRIAQLRLAETDTQDFLDIASERGALRQYISEYSSLLALIRLLPVEMLGRIFIQPAIHNSEMFGSTVVTMYRPKVIGEVSHHWREVARGTPKLNRPPLPDKNTYQRSLKVIMKSTTRSCCCVVLLVLSGGIGFDASSLRWFNFLLAEVVNKSFAEHKTKTVAGNLSLACR